MWTTASEGTGPRGGAPHIGVIGAAWLLVLAGVAAIGPREMVTLVSSYVPTPLQAALLADPPCDEVPDGVPVSIQIQNEGDADDRLLGASTPVAQCVGARRVFLVQGRRETAPVSDGIVIPAHATVSLEPGKSHLSLFGLRTDLVQGETFPLTVRFEHAGEATVIARVRRRVDAAGITQLPEVSLGDLTISLVSAPPAPRAEISLLSSRCSLARFGSPVS